MTTTSSKGSDPKEMAALRRNVESLTQISKQHTKQMALLTKEKKILKDQVRTLKANAKVAEDDARRAALATSKSKSSEDDNAKNVLGSRIRALQHDLTLSQRNEQEAKKELERMKEEKKK